MYDPLVDRIPPSDKIKPASFWAEGHSAKLYPSLDSVIDVEVAIVGAGFTGLSAAYHLRHQYGVECAVLEASQPGYGCSGRNGGFVLPGTGRLSNAASIARYGEETTLNMYEEYHRSIETTSRLIDTGIDCERVEGGYLKLAHEPKQTSILHEQANLNQQHVKEKAIALSSDEVCQQYLAGAKSFGGVYYPDAFSVNPWLLTQGLARLTEHAGVPIFGSSPVISHQDLGQSHELKTINGKVRAKSLIVATNAYTPRNLFSILVDKTFPVISSIVVTEPLSSEQLELINMKSGLMVMDTRPLKYYYRLLPDNRLLFGGRGAITGKNAGLSRYKDALVQGLQQTFPSLTNIAIDKFWSGWVAISYDDLPRIFHDRQKRCLYSAGYCGAGLAFSLQAGKRLAELYAEPAALPELPFWQTPLKTFPLPMLRRPALRAFYLFEKMKQLIN